MSNYVLSFKFEGVSDEVAEKFAKAAASVVNQLKQESYDGVESLQVAIVRVEEKSTSPESLQEIMEDEGFDIAE